MSFVFAFPQAAHSIGCQRKIATNEFIHTLRLFILLIYTYQALYRSVKAKRKTAERRRKTTPTMSKKEVKREQEDFIFNSTQ